jgi:hypothetical protein
MRVCRLGHFAAAMAVVEQDWPHSGAAMAELAPMSALLAARGEIAAQGWETAVFDSSVAGFAWQRLAAAFSAFGCTPTNLAAPAGSIASAELQESY